MSGNCHAAGWANNSLMRDFFELPFENLLKWQSELCYIIRDYFSDCETTAYLDLSFISLKLDTLKFNSVLVNPINPS